MPSNDTSDLSLIETDFAGLDEFFELALSDEPDAEAKLKEMIAELPAEAAA
jgi:hypothetical protein